MNSGRGQHQKAVVFREAGMAQGLAYLPTVVPAREWASQPGTSDSDGGEAVVSTNLRIKYPHRFQDLGGDFVDATLQTGCSMFPSGRPASASACWIWKSWSGRTVRRKRRGKGLGDATGRAVSLPPACCSESEARGKGSQDVTKLPLARPSSAPRSADAVPGDVNTDGGVDIEVDQQQWSSAPAAEYGAGTGALDSGSCGGSSLQSFRIRKRGRVFRKKDGSSVKRYVRGDGSYLAANDPEFTSVSVNRPRWTGIQVRWLAGACESWNQITVDRIVNLREGSGQPCPASSSNPGHWDPPIRSPRSSSLEDWQDRQLVSSQSVSSTFDR